MSPTPGKCGCYYSFRESEISCRVTLEDVCPSALGGETPNPSCDLEFQNPQKALSMLENGISIDPDSSNFSRLTVEVVVLFPKDCHEGTMVRLCAETEWCSTCQCLLSRPRFGVWKLGMISDASNFSVPNWNPNNFLWGSLGDDEIFMLCLGFGIGMIKNAEVVWCWWSPVHGCRWRWKARCKNHLAGKKTTWDGGFVPTSPHFFQFFPYQIFRSIVMINGPCSVAMMKT